MLQHDDEALYRDNAHCDLPASVAGNQHSWEQQLIPHRSVQVVEFVGLHIEELMVEVRQRNAIIAKPSVLLKACLAVLLLHQPLPTNFSVAP